MIHPIDYCNRCGAETQLAVPEGDQQTRHVCTSCDYIHYINPKIITGCLIEHEDKILLCRRAIEPQYGKWTLPAGFMENNETCSEGAARESYEEANANINNIELYSVYDIPHISQVYMIYRAQLSDLDFYPGTESLEVQLFEKENIPWTSLSFSVIRQVLIAYYGDKKAGRYTLKTGTITAEMKSLLNEAPKGI